MTACAGRVFDRWRQFETLPEDVKTTVTSIKEYLATKDVQTEVFTTKRGTNKVKPITTAPGSAVLTAIKKKLEESGTSDTSPENVKKVADGLVLSGVLTPQNDVTVLEGFAFETATFIVVDPLLTGDATAKSVWSMREGAIQAGMLKRKRSGFFAKLTAKPQVYVVCHEPTKSVYIYESEVSRFPLNTVDVSSGTVEFDGSVQHGIKLSNSSVTEVFTAVSKEKQEEWLNSFINTGAKYREAFNLASESVNSFYELKDYDMQGNEVSMEKYKGKVILVVNVSSLCGLTPTNYPELTQLDEKYRDQGLQILAFPCNQFNNQEPGTHEEIMEFVKQYKCTFPFFEKHDVNGADARPVFTYLKAKLPGSFGNFVKWNFTKFLIDRNGQPYKRYAPKDLPFSFEEDIKKLIEQPATSIEPTIAAATEAPVSAEKVHVDVAATEQVDSKAEEKEAVAVSENETTAASQDNAGE